MHALCVISAGESIMTQKKCRACGKNFQSHPQVPGQKYCSAPACQKERRRRWQRDKLKQDPDYQENQARAQQAWAERNPDYWREYRQAQQKNHAINRFEQPQRTQQDKTAESVKMDESNAAKLGLSGVYLLSRPPGAGNVKMDVWLVEIRFISCGYDESG